MGQAVTGSHFLFVKPLVSRLAAGLGGAWAGRPERADRF